MTDISFHINLYDLGYLGVVFLGSGLATFLCFTKKHNQSANRFLTLALVVVVMYMIRLLATDLYLTWVPFHFLMAVGPLLFFYVRKVTIPEFTLRSKDSLHFIPLLAELVFEGLAKQENNILAVLAFISFTSYIFLSIWFVKAFCQRIAFVGGDRYRVKMRWLYQILVAVGIVNILLTSLFAIDMFRYGTYTSVPESFYLIFGGLMIWFSGVALLKTERQLPENPGYLREATPLTLKHKGGLLKRALKRDKYYRDPELNLRSLAEKMELHPNELSKVINSVFNKSFSDLINEFRVAEVVSKMKDPAYDHLTLLGIAYESGFNSKTTFNRTFKELTGKNPAEYKNELKKERPDYKLERSLRFEAILSYKKTSPSWDVNHSIRSVMIKNYFKIAWRNLVRNKSYTSINIAGLSVSIAACVLIFLVVQYETSFDNYHVNKDRIYRILRTYTGPDGVHSSSGTPLPLTEGMKQDIPQLKLTGNIFRNGGSLYTIDNDKGTAVKKFKEDFAYYADPGFFRIFDFKWLAGDKNTALAEPNQVVLSRSEADKFFGDWHKAMGRMIRYENQRYLVVSGIVEDTPVNTDIPMKLAVSWSTAVAPGGDLHGNAGDWISTFGDRNIYLVLPPGMDETTFNKELWQITKKNIPSVASKKDTYKVQALKDIHYDTEAGVYSGHAFSKDLIKVISLIALFLIIVACVNFVNLATAQAVNRSKEVGVRKVLGSSRYQLVLQFISETLIITFFAITVGAVLSLISLPLLNSLLEIHLESSLLADPKVISFLAIVIIGVTLLAGLYPALILSGFNPVTALKNKVTAGRTSGISLRRVLVVTQFCIAQFLVIGTLVLIYQMNYFKNKSLGFNTDATLIVPTPTDSVSRTRSTVFKDELLKLPGVNDVSISQYTPSDGDGWFSDFKFDHAEKAVDFAACLKWTDANFFKLYNIQFVAGGPYPHTDTIAGYVVNETLIHKLGITDPKQAIGKEIMLWDNKKLSARITGVVKDYHAGSLRKVIPPVLMGSWKAHYSMANVKINLSNAKQTLTGIENLWNTIYPEGVYEYQFLDQSIAQFYKKEEQLSTLYKIFAGIAIFISCLGLYGLVSFMAVQRTKEVGIRKTLGASVGNIVYLFSKEFTVLILLAFMISAPIGYFLMHQWLQNYTYRIDIGPEIFIIAISVSALIAWLSVGYKAVLAALADPVKSLKSE